MAKRFRRSSTLEVADDVYGGSASARARGKWAVNPYPPLTDKEVTFLRLMCQDNGSLRVARWIGVHELTVLRVAADLGYRCTVQCMAKFREFFAEADLDSIRRGKEPDGRDSPKQRGKPNGTKRKAA